MFHIVIADDEPAIRNGLRDLFPWAELNAQIGYLASNGQDALDYISSHPVDLVLSDIRMPIMDGLMLSKTLHDSYPSVCTVLISAYTDFEYARKAMRYGVREYITKPIDYEAFLVAMRRILSELTPEEGTGDVSYAGYYEEIAGQIKRYIQENLSSATLTGAADRVGLSANYISRIFHSVFDLTFTEYLLKCRMEVSLALLQNGKNLEDTAWTVGYSSSRGFKQAFTKHFGQTPHSCLSNLKTEEPPHA